MERAARGSGAASLKRLAAAVEGFVAQLQCAICLCAYASPASLPCNHCFCEECIHRALELKPVCPICKAPAKKRKLRYDSMIQQLLHATEMLNAPVKTEVASEAKKAAKQGVQEAKIEDDALLLHEEKPLPSTSNGTKHEQNGVPQTAAEVGSEQNGHAQSDTEPAEAVRRSWKAATSVHKATNGSQQQHEKADNEQVIGEILPESNLTVSSIDSEQVKMPAWSVPASVVISEVNPPAADSAPGAQPKAKRKASALVAAVNTVAAANPSASASETTVVPGATSGTESQSQPPHALSQQYPLNGPFSKGQFVEVADRMWVGINKPGGAARITNVNADGTYNVKYLLESRSESNIPDYFVAKPKDEVEADVSPGRAVKQRQRRSTKQALDNTPSSEEQTPTPSASARSKSGGKGRKAAGKRKRSEMVFLCSGYDEKGMREIEKWSETLDAEIVASWTNQVTHLIVKCIVTEEKSSDVGGDGEKPNAAETTAERTGDTPGKRELFSDVRPVARWVKIRSMKYLKALVGGRWIVSEEWLQACAAHGGRVSEADFEADGHLKGKNIDDAVRRSRKRRQENLQTSPAGANPALIGTKLFEDFCFHLVGDFLPPMPPQSELDTLLSIGGGKRIRALGDIAKEMAKEENANRELVIVSDRINPVGLRDISKQLRSLPQIKALSSNVAIVNYQWVLNSISEAKLRPLK